MEPEEELVEPKIEDPETYQQPTTCLPGVTLQNSSPIEVPSQDSNNTTLTVIDNKSVHIKEELDHGCSESTVVATNFSESILTVSNLDHGFSQSTVALSNHTPNDDCNNDQLSTATIVANVDHMHLLKSLETTIRETIEVNKLQEIVELKQIVENTNLLDKCIEELTSYRKYLTESILNFHSEINKSDSQGNGALSQESCQNRLTNALKPTTGEGEEGEQVSKRQKLDVSDETVIKSEPEEGNNLVFSPIEDKITTMEVIMLLILFFFILCII